MTKKAVYALIALLPCLLPAFGAELTHGPIVGRASARGMRVWLRTSEAAPFHVAYGTSTNLTADSTKASGKTSSKDDNTGYVEIDGLQPDTRYFYAVMLDNKLITEYGDTHALPSFRTWPESGTTRHKTYNPRGLCNLEFGVTFGNNLGGIRGSPVYRHIIDRHADDWAFFIMNGDYIYEYARRKVPVAEYTLDTYREDYKSYLKEVPSMAALFREVPMLFVFDDHELGPEQSTADVGYRVNNRTRTYRTLPVLRDWGIKVWYEYCGWATYDKPYYQPVRLGTASVSGGKNILTDEQADFTKRRPETITTLHCHRDTRNAGVYGIQKIIGPTQLKVKPSFRHGEKNMSYSIGTHHFHDFEYNNCHFFVLDARSARTTYRYNLRKNPRQFVLGKRQLNWLLEGVRKSKADFVFIVSSVNWMVYHNASHVKGRAVAPAESPKEDGMSGSLVEREKLLTAFDELQKPVLILTGDLHSSFAIQITDNVWEFMCGPIGSGLHPIESAGNPPFGGWFSPGGRKVKIKWANSYPLSLIKQKRKLPRGINNVYGIIKVNNVFPGGKNNNGNTIWVAHKAPQVIVQFRSALSDDVLYAEGISVLDAR